MSDEKDFEFTARQDSSRVPDCVALMKAEGWQVVGSVPDDDLKYWIFKRKLEAGK